MLLTTDNLINLPVYTQSGEILGKIKEIEIDPSTQAISRYFIKSNQMIKRLSAKQLIIRPNQVISLDKRKMIVEDAVIRQESLVGEAATL